MVTYTVPVYVDTGTLAGVVTADVTLDWLNDRMKSIHIGETGYGVLLSHEGQIMAHPDEAVFESHQNAIELNEARGRKDITAIVRSMLAGESDFVPFHDIILNKAVLLSYGPVGRAGWSLAVAYPEDELFADVVRLFRRQLLLLVTGLVALVGLVLFLSRQITSPITALAGSAGKLASGDLDLELPEVRSRDEIGTLTGAFHDMRDELKTYIHDLEVTTKAKQKLESELQIAHDIQMAMLPKPPKGDDERYELAARLEPARAVGGASTITSFTTGSCSSSLETSPAKACPLRSSWPEPKRSLVRLRAERPISVGSSPPSIRVWRPRTTPACS